MINILIILDNLPSTQQNAYNYYQPYSQNTDNSFMPLNIYNNGTLTKSTNYPNFEVYPNDSYISNLQQTNVYKNNKKDFKRYFVSFLI